MSDVSTSNLIRFSPGAGGGGGSADTKALSVALTVRLDGVSTTTYSDPRFKSTLLVAFDQPSICTRATLTGINPAGHAPLVLEEAWYVGSTGEYHGPSGAPYWAYTNAETSVMSGEKLVIDYPVNDNLFGLFSWPLPIVTYDPPLAQGEQAPLVSLALVALRSLDEPTTEGESQIGVQLPHRLFFKKAGETLDHLLRELDYEEAPSFTGSGTSVRAKPKPAWELTWADLRAAAAAAYGEANVAGDYQIYWKIYKGGGDMVYKLRCLGGVQGNEYVDRRIEIGGGLGTEATTNLLAAHFRLRQTPYPFIYNHNAYSNFNCAADIQSLDKNEYLIGDGHWRKADGTVLSWTQTNFYLGGRLAASQSIGSCLCACLMHDEAGREWLQAFVQLVDGRVLLMRKLMIVDKEWEYSEAVELPEYSFNNVVAWWTTYRTFNRDGTKILCYDQTRNSSGGLCTARTMRPATVVEIGINQTISYGQNGAITIQFSLGDFTLIGIYDFRTSIQYSFNESTQDVTCSASTLLSAFYDDNNNLVERFVYANCVNGTGDFVVKDNDTEKLRIQWYKEYKVERTVVVDPAHGVTNPALVHMVTYDRNIIFDIGSQHENTQSVAKMYINGAQVHEFDYRGERFNNCWDLRAVDYNPYNYRYYPADTDAHLSSAWPVTPGGFNEPNVWNVTCSNPANDYQTYYKRSTTLEPDPISRVRDILQYTTKNTGMLYHVNDGNCVAANCRLYFRDSSALTSSETPADFMSHFHLACTSGNVPASLESIYGGLILTSQRITINKPDPTTRSPGDPNAIPSAQDLLSAHNDIRQANGLNALTMNDELTLSAALHCQWMVNTGKISHVETNGSTPLQRAIVSGYTGVSVQVGENLAAYQVTVSKVMEDWMGSHGHRANILGETWEDFGCYILPWAAGFVWVTEFGVRT